MLEHIVMWANLSGTLCDSSEIPLLLLMDETMAKACWKQFERYIASIFTTTRTPLSGGNGKVTRSDTFHPSLFLSMKYTQSNHLGLRKLVDEEREKAKVENKTAVCIIGQAGDRSNALAVIHLKDLPQFCQDIRDGKIEITLEPRS